MEDKKVNKPKEREKLNKRTIFTITAMANITWYAIAVLIANFFDHPVQAELTVAWFSAWTVELALLYGIQIKKNDDSSENNIANNTTQEEDNCTEDNTINIDNCDNSDGGVG